MRPKLLDEMSALGLAKCGVLDTLKASPRSCTLKRSVILILRKTPMSTLMRPGPRSTPVPQVPKRGVLGLTALGSARLRRSHHWVRRPTFSTGPLQSAKLLEPGAFRAVAGAVGV